jgi:SAM-dependent methyltransferase
MDDAVPRLYDDLAGWFHLLTAPEDYAEEAGIFAAVLEEHVVGSCHRVLELGSGGGNNASHLKARFAMTLVDRSEAMLEISRGINPECRHLAGDMRTVRLGETFDAVFVHDAVTYLTTTDDLAAAMTTAFVHCRPGGVALFVPDWTTETFRPSTDHGGHDGEGRALRYLEWTHDPHPGDHEAITDMVYLLRDGDRVEAVHDRHPQGVFPRRTWLDLMAAAGFVATAVPFEHSDFAPEEATEMFVARRPAG